ncbi:unnamed protein product [Closterium sp. NIES-53]
MRLRYLPGMRRVTVRRYLRLYRRTFRCTGGAGAAGPGGARTRGTGGAGAGGVGGSCTGAGGTGARGVGASSPGGAGVTDGAKGTGGAGAAGPGGARTQHPGAGGAGTGGARVGAGGTMQRRPFFVPPPLSSLPPPDSVLRQVLSLPSSTGLTPSLLCPPPHQLQTQLQPDSPLPAPSSYAEQTDSLTEHREPESRPASPACAVRTGHRVPLPRPPPVPGTHIMTLRPSSVPLRVPLQSPPASSLADGPDPESDLARAATPTVRRLLATVVSDPSFESIAASALVAELVEFAAACRLDYAASLVAESESDCPPSVGGECALGTDVLEARQKDFECLVAVVPHLVAMLLAPEGDPDAPDIPTPRSYAETITVPLSGANIVDDMWIFRVKRPPGSSPAFKARYVARGFSQRQGRDYKLRSLDFSTNFLQGSLHEEKWMCRPSGFTGSFPAGTQWRILRPVYGLCQAPREWHDTLRTTLAALGFAPSTAYPSLFLRTDTSLPPFYVLVYVLQHFGFRYSLPQSTPLPTGHSLSAPPSDESVEPSGPYPELVGCLMYLLTCTRPDLAYPLSIVTRYVAPERHRPEHWEAAKKVLRYLCSTSGMGLQLGGRSPVVLTGLADASWVDDLATQRSSQGYTFSLGVGSVSWQSTRSSFLLSSSCEAEIYAGAMGAQELRWLTYLLTDLGERPRSSPVLTKHISLRYFLARELQQCGHLRLAYVATQANTADVNTKALQPGDHQRFCTVLDLMPTLPHLLTA